MSQQSWNPWKVTAIGMALVLATALISGLVVANWTGHRDSEEAVALEPVTAAVSPATGPRAPAAGSPPTASVTVPSPAPRQGVVQSVGGVPPRAVVEACNQDAARAIGQRDKTAEVVKDAVIGAVAGAAVGAAGGAIAQGGKGAGKGAAIGGVVGAGAGTLYGLNENKRNDERYREAYAACMRARGYIS